MTLAQAVAKLSAEIDVLLQQRLDAMALQMIGDGVDPTATPPATEDADGDWQRITFDGILQRQREIDAAWKRCPPVLSSSGV